MKGGGLNGRAEFSARVAKTLNSRRRLFWALQIGGWISYFILYTTFAFDFDEGARSISGQAMQAMATAAAAAFAGFVISSCLRFPYRRLRRLPILEALTFALPFLVLGSVVFALVEGFVVRAILDYDIRLVQSLLYVPTKLYLLGAWSALYFSITYYMQLKQETERALRADAAAKHAQLQMLRYQLNPHFLFNALNAVSALILDEDNARADRLVARLSAFLRHSLLSEAKEKVSVEQEISANLIYLEIEKTRFAERLEFSTHISPAARHALVPSLLLQPLIENAVKYAVAPREEGGRIAVSAMVEADRLTILVEDDGPGMPIAASQVLGPESCGVGLTNTANRLRHVYGEDHRFEIASSERLGGAQIRIEVPLEAAEPIGALDSNLRKAA